MKDSNNRTADNAPSGNIWGWRFSYISFGIILFFVGFIVLRHWMLGVPFNSSTIQAPSPTVQDSSKIETKRDSLQ